MPQSLSKVLLHFVSKVLSVTPKGFSILAQGIALG
jgi:hypothetical protein